MESESVYEPLRDALHRAIGPTLARFKILDPEEGYVPRARTDDQASMPLEFAANAIRMRRGDHRLRGQLIEAYGGRCAMTGTCPADLLEVAYIVPFPSGDVHTPGNAILLRTDVHTLWDLGLIGVDPETLAVEVAPRLAGTVYENLAGRRLGPREDQARLDRAGLRERWEAFHGTPSGKSGSGSRGPRSTGRRPGDDATRPTIEVKPRTTTTPPAPSPDEEEAKSA
jgi:hypothetical protein